MNRKEYVIKKETMAKALLSIGDGVILTDEKGTIEFINSAACEIARCSERDAVGERFDRAFSIINTKTGKRIEDLIDKVVKHRNVVGLKNHSALVLKGGSRKYLSASFSPIIYEPEKVSGVVIVFKDVTKMKKMEEEARQASRAKSEFLANMSHEIRTPLNGIVGMIDLTLITDVDEEQKENLETAKDCAGLLLNIINDILDFSKMEAGKLALESCDFEVKKMILEIMNIHRVPAAQKGISLEYSLPDDVSKCLKGDANRLKQVINNLISNAIKFTDEGSVVLKVERIEGQKGMERLKFTVDDTGIGISQEDMNRLFKSFVQIESSFTKRFRGTGLGLAICKNLISMMGGEIWVESDAGKGSRFCFIVELEKAQGCEEEKIQPYSVVSHKQSRRILLSEDDRVNRNVISKMLRQGGYSVDTACDGERAVELSLENSYDAILMDVQMPKMDGVQATRIIRERESCGGYTPIIGITAFARREDELMFIRAGMDEYISKPVNMRKLLDVVGRTVSLKRLTGMDFDKKAVVGENGELSFVKFETRDIPQSHIEMAEEVLEEISTDANDRNWSSIEKKAHNIKVLFEKENENLREAAFKIELSARNEDIEKVSESVSGFESILGEFKPD